MSTLEEDKVNFIIHFVTSDVFAESSLYPKSCSAVVDVVCEACKKKGIDLATCIITDLQGRDVPCGATVDDLDQRAVALIDREKRDPLELANELCDVSWQGNQERFYKMLLSRHYLSVVNVPNNRGQSALYCAAYQGHMHIVIKLLSVGSDVNYQVPIHGSTPLHAAVFCSHPTVMAVLILAGADLEMKNKWGRTPLQEAISKEGFRVRGMVKKDPTKTSHNLQQAFPELVDFVKEREDPETKKMERRRILMLRLQELESVAHVLITSNQTSNSSPWGTSVPQNLYRHRHCYTYFHPLMQL
eukprot:TRINITY_DN6088_c0_g1_i1.p1 TRINITY_DN6088_c0_g1~~TRINITY_DN6088_c0_g1_i1.p1  ORF type:complete len:301 (+),score=40.84 TRINITY_DN6088_c0_g1_i1:121-1023(+)